jgi:3-oxoadipate enol-lactonase (EC 3.1.1.24)
VHQLARSEAEGYAECCEALAAADLRGEVAEIRVPMLIIAGEHDPVTTVADADFLHQHVPGSQAITLPASHLSNVEAAAAFTEALAAFVRGQNGR